VKRNFAVIGGDLRSLKLVDFLREDGHKVNIFGFGTYNQRSKPYNQESEPMPFPEILKENQKDDNQLSTIIHEADAVIGPVPCSNDNETINAPFHSEKIYINDVLKKMNKNQIFIAGRISSKIAHLAEVYNVYTVDILDREEMAILNAIPTAEGAIQIAMEEMPITLHGSNSLVMGFGRIGKILAKMLHGLGANTFVSVRKYSDIAWIKSYGYKPILISETEKYLPYMDVVFNTIPAMVLDEKRLSKLKNDCLVIDLASSPGGVDFEKAKALGLKVNWALSLPGKVAPVTAAKFIRDTIYNILEELGV